MSENARQQISDSLKQYYQTPEGRAWMWQHANGMRGSANPNYGKTHSYEAKQQISQKNSGVHNGNYNKTGILHHNAKPVYCQELNQFFV